MVNVKVFNAEKFNEALVLHNIDGETLVAKHGLIEVPDGFIVTDNEAIHSASPLTMDSKYIVDVYPKPKIVVRDGKETTEIPLSPFQVEMPMHEALQYFDNVQTLISFVRRFGDRIESNYSVLVSTLKEHGMDVSDCDQKARSKQTT
jgi:hypothetical protein